MGKFGETLSAILLTASLLNPFVAFAKEIEIFDQNYGKKNVSAILHQDENILTFQITSNDAKDNPIIGHPDIYIIHPKEVGVSNVQRGYLHPQKNWVNLESLEGVVEFFKGKVNKFFNYISKDKIGIEEWIAFVDSFRSRCEIDEVRIRRTKNSLEKTLKDPETEYVVTEIPKRAEGINMTAIKYDVIFDVNRMESAGKVQIGFLAALNNPGKSPCVSFDFALGEEEKQKDETFVYTDEQNIYAHTKKGNRKIAEGKNPRLSPLGDKIAFISSDWKYLHVTDLNGEILKKIRANYDGFNEFSWSSDGERITFIETSGMATSVLGNYSIGNDKRREFKIGGRCQKNVFRGI